jgi:hypothetical protein
MHMHACIHTYIYTKRPFRDATQLDSDMDESLGLINFIKLAIRI